MCFSTIKDIEDISRLGILDTFLTLPLVLVGIFLKDKFSKVTELSSVVGTS